MLSALAFISNIENAPSGLYQLMAIKAARRQGATMAAMNSDETFDAERRRALDALGRVSDPEIGESIVELGLVERLEITPARIALALVLTSPTCPMGDAIADDAFQALQEAFPGREVTVEEADGVQWDPSRLSASARERLGWNDEA